jgi:tRNA-specific 2-thiouridylase
LQFFGDTEQFHLHFDTAQWAVTLGQSAVLYDGDICLGGGIIHSASTENEFW